MPPYVVICPKILTAFPVQSKAVADSILSQLDEKYPLEYNDISEACSIITMVEYSVGTDNPLIDWRYATMVEPLEQEEKEEEEDYIQKTMEILENLLESEHSSINSDDGTDIEEALVYLGMLQKAKHA